MSSSEGAPNLAHVVPDVKKTLKGADLSLFFTNNDITEKPDDYSSPYYTLFPSNLPSSEKGFSCSRSRSSSYAGAPQPTLTSLKPDGIDAAYIDNVLTPGTALLIPLHYLSLGLVSPMLTVLVYDH